MLKKTSRALQSDVLSDGAIPKKLGISTSRPITFGTITLRQERLLDAFRQALGGQKVMPLVTDSGKRLDVRVNIEKNGSAVLTLNKTKYVFTHAGLMSPDTKTRLGYLEQFLRERTLAKVYADELRAKVAGESLSNDDFLEVIETLLTSPEQFVQAVNGKVRAKNLTNTDLLPGDLRYWDNLIAPLEESKTLEEFIDRECAAQRDDLIQQDAERAFLISALSFCAPRLVPLAKFRALDAETVLKMLAPALVLGDHFAVVGAFEICADRLVRDSRFEEVGGKLLDHLLKDMEELKQRCAFYAAIYALTVARLAQHEVLHRKSPFWRRVTAAAHTSLVARACGPENAEATYSWALGHSGKSFVYSVLLEGNEEPRWKPDWLTPKHFVADAFGRIDSAVNKIPEAQRPKAWLDYISKAREWIAAQNAELLCMFPAIGESARRAQPTHDQTGRYQPVLQELYDKPSFDSFIQCTPAFYTVGVTKEALAASHEVMSQLQKEETRLAEGFTPHIIQTLSFVAMQTRDENLADAVAEFCVQKTRELTDEDGTAEIISRLLECASAIPDFEKAMNDLALRLERISYLAPAAVSVDLHDSLRHLQILSEGLSQKLGKALAVSRVGRMAD